MTWRLRAPGRDTLLALLALSALLLGLMNCSVVESVSATSHHDGHGNSPAGPDAQPNCCALLVFLPQESGREPFAGASTCQINGGPVLATGKARLGQEVTNPVGASRDRAPPSNQQDITCVPCGLRAPPGRVVG